MWPISAAIPKAPRCSSPLSTMPPPTPVPTVTRSRSSTSCAGAEGELTPGRGVRVVLDHDRQTDALLQVGLEWLVAPGEVGREQHRRPSYVDEARGPDADGDRCRAAPASSATTVLDGHLDRVGVRRRRDPSRRREDVALLVHHATGDLGAPDVHTHGEGHQSSSHSVVVEVDLLHGPAAALRPRLRHLRRHRPGQRLHQRAGRGARGAALTSGLVPRTTEITWHTGQYLQSSPSVAMWSLIWWSAPARRRPRRRRVGRGRRRSPWPSPGARPAAWRPPRRARRPSSSPVPVTCPRSDSGRNRTCRAPSSTLAPATTCLARAAGRAISLRYEPTVTTSSSPCRARSMSDLATNGSAIRSTAPVEVREMVIGPCPVGAANGSSPP